MPLNTVSLHDSQLIIIFSFMYYNQTVTWRKPWLMSTTFWKKEIWAFHFIKYPLMPHFSSLKFSCIYRRWQLNKCLSVSSKSESYCVTGTHSFFSSLCFLSLVHTRSLCWTYSCKQANSFARWVQVCTEKNWINFKLILVFLLNSRGQCPYKITSWV